MVGFCGGVCEVIVVVVVGWRVDCCRTGLMGKEKERALQVLMKS